MIAAFLVTVISFVLFIIGVVASLNNHPLTFFSNTIPETIFAIVSGLSFFGGLLVIPFRRHEKLLGEQRKLKIQPLPCPETRIACTCSVQVHNPANSPATNVRLKLMRITPVPFKPKPYDNQEIKIPFPILLFPMQKGGETIYPESNSDFTVFTISQKGFEIQVTVFCQPRDITFSPKIEKQEFIDVTYAEYEIELEASSLIQPPTRARFKLSFSTANGAKLYALTQI